MMKNCSTHAVSSPLGLITLAASEKGLCGIWFENQKHGPSLTMIQSWRIDPSNTFLQQTQTQLLAYFSGQHTGFHVPLDLSIGTPFQQSVWQALLTIPSGSSQSYGHLARQLNNPKAVRAVGGQQELIVDVRILCATHKDLAGEVAAGRFRQDLYYRLNVIELRVPALRERREDIALLAGIMLKRLAEGTGLSPAKLDDDALEKLKSYRFPGNVRELENMLERAYTLCEDDRITTSDLRLADSMPISENGEANLAQIDNLEDYLEAIERKLIMQALEETRWNRTAAAQRLGLSFRSMRYRLKKLGID